jgi:Glycosyl hydrolase catalytic core
VFKRIALIATVVATATGLAVQAATASPKHHAGTKSTHLLVGINDEANTLYGNTTTAFQTLATLKPQVLRVNLYWGGTKWAASRNGKPTDPTDPGDPAYDWSLYDRLVRYAALSHIQVMFSILFTPSWANGGKGKNVAPTNAQDLEDFAHAAGIRYSGYYAPPPWQQDLSYGNGATFLPEVNMWTAWNEPNNPDWLTPQYKRVGGKWRIESAFQYAKICNAVYSGIHSVLISPLKGAPVGEKVACGVTGPKGNDAPSTKRASVDPLSFLTAAKQYGMKTFDVYAHHPYANAGNESPTYIPTGNNKRRIQLGNINTLLALVTKLYGPKHLWITEYGYQTNPPDRSVFGTSWKNQAAYMKQAYAIARKNPRIDMMLWFLVRDEPSLGGWQSGLETVGGKKKPSWTVFQQLPRG